MNNAIKLAKQTFTWSVVAMTVLASMGVAAFAPLTATAATCPTLRAGDLFKVSGVSAVYLLDSSMNAMYFPHSEVYNSWFEDFSGVQVIDASCTDAYPVGQGVNFRAGARMVKRAISPTVYVVEPGNMISKLGSEAVASALYGANWGSLVRDVSDAFWNNYKMSGKELTEMKPHNGQLLKVAGSSDVYLVVGGSRVKVDGAVRGDVRTVSQATIDLVSMGSGSVTSASLYASPSQGAVGSSTPTGSTPVVSSGDVTVALAASTPASATVPVSSTHVAFVTVNVSAGTDAATVRGLTFTRVGLGSRNNFDKVWLEVDGMPVSNEQTISSDDTVTLTPNYKISAGGTVAMSLVANLKNASGQTSNLDGFRLASASAVDVAGGKVMGSFPVSGNLMTYSSFVIGETTISRKGSAATVKVGAEEILGEFQLVFSASSNDADGQLIYVRLKNSGTGEMSDLKNLALYQSGTKVSSKTEVFGNYVTFMVDSVLGKLRDGSSRSYEIKADVAGGDNAKTYIFELKDNRDVFVKDTSVNVGSSFVNSISGGAGTNQLSMYTLDAGQFTVNLDSTNPSNMNVAKGADAVVALVAKMDVGQATQVDGLKVYLTGSAINGNTAAAVDGLVEKATLWVGGKQISSVSSLSGSGTVSASVVDSGLHYNFNSSFIINDNDLVKIVLDIKDNPSPATTGTLKLAFSAGTSFDSPEYVSNGDSVVSGQKSGTATGNAVDVIGASLTITRNDGFASAGETLIAGNTEYKLVSFLVSAGTSDSVKIRTLNFDFSEIASSTPSLHTYFTNLKMKIGGTQVGNTQSMSDAGAFGTVTFNNIDKVVAKNGQVTVEFYATVNSGLPTGTRTTVTLDADESVLEDSQGTSVTYTTDVDSTILTFNANATLTVAVDGDTATSAVLVAGGASVVDVATFKLSARDGAVSVTELRLANVTSTVSAETSAADARVTELTLWTGGVQIGSAKQFSNGLAHFVLSSGDLVVPRDGNARVMVKAKFGAVTQASQTGAAVRISLWGIKAETQSSGSQLTSVGNLAVGSTPATSTAALGAAVGNMMSVHATRPTLTSGSIGTERLANGAKDIYKFTVAADATGDVTWKRLILDVTGQCTGAIGNTSNPTFCIGASSSMKLKLNNVEKTAYFNTTTNKLHIVLGGVETVTAGTSKTYVLNTSLSGFTIENDSLSIKVIDTHTASSVGAFASVATGVFVWSDNAGEDESLTEAHWMNGFKVNGLDTAAYTLTQ